jgi:hypothetical protein
MGAMLGEQKRARDDHEPDQDESYSREQKARHVLLPLRTKSVTSAA